MPASMLEYRVTKYNPSFRDASGAYTREEWTSAGHVGRSFDGDMLTADEYRRVEDAYVAVAIRFLNESGQIFLMVSGLENNRRYPIEFAEGSVIGLDDIGSIIRLILREEFWCRLEAPLSFLHFGWDYYMYIGVPCACPQSQGLAMRSGLFVEDFLSPYKDE